jgi:hypothetical protein
MTRRLFFVHVPKTAGVTLKTYLENLVASPDVLAIDEAEARALSPEALNRYRVWSGHYDASVLRALDPAPTTVLLVRDPVARLRSWAAHGRRLRDPELGAPFVGRTDLDVARENEGGKARQAFWLNRALVAGAPLGAVPEIDTLDTLLDQVHVVGLTECFDRTLQLLSFEAGAEPPPLGWWLNRRPESDSAPVESDEVSATTRDDDALRACLGVDCALYDKARTRFWRAYGRMLARIAPDGTTAPVERLPTDIDVPTVQQWLRAWHARTRAVRRESAESVTLDGNAAMHGTGWWWRECPGPSAYRWTGPGTATSIDLGALDTSRAYTATIDVCGAATWDVWNGLTMSINGLPLTVDRRHIDTENERRVTLRATAVLPPHVLERRRDGAELVLSVASTASVPGSPWIDESLDTRRRDVRHVGLAVQRISVTP